MRKFLETDQNYWEVPCPFCGAYQKLIFEQLKWDEGKPSTVKYKCVHCDAMIDEDYKDSIVGKGKFCPAKKENVSSKKIGFHINSLYAPTAFFSWTEIVETFLAAQKDPNKMKVFTNTILGDTFSETSEAPKFENLYNKRELYNINTINNDVCFLTMGADVQKDRIECEIVGWCANKESYSIDYRVLIGSPNLPDVWHELERIINDVWIRDDGTEMPIRLTAIDSGGHHTSEVYDFCRRFSYNKVIPIKGSSNYQSPAVAAPRTIDYNMKGKKIGKTKVWIIGVSYLKHELYSWLGIEKTDELEKPMYCHFPEYDVNYFKGLASESYIPSKRIWKKTYERNEPLDCRVYARAASIVVGLDRMKPEQIEALSGAAKRVRREINTNDSQIKPNRERRKMSDSIW
jgi:phage terminase large subunit GpA-like protein